MTEEILSQEIEFGVEAATSKVPENPLLEPLFEAIENRRKIAIRYDRDRFARPFAPYLVRLAKNGNLIVAGLQIENPNSLDGDNERRTFSLSKIKTLELTTETFEPIETFSPDDPANSYGIIACVLPWQ